ncbi:MAG: ribose-phosphate pyrophosphokinase [Clostridia bacterium]
MLNRTHGLIKLFSGTSNPALAQKIADCLDMRLGRIEAGKFSDGETMVNILETVRGCDVFIIQSTSTPVNDNLMELLVIIDAVRRASAGRITVVMPYFGYARQDRKARARDPISAKLVANLLEKAGVDRVLTMDLHSAQLQGFFDVPVDNLLGMPVLCKHFIKKGFRNEDLVVVSPDVGSVARSRKMATAFDCPLAIIDKRRPKANVMEVMNIVGDVNGKTCLMLDDMIDTGGTITQGAKALMDNGATRIVACCSHGVLSGPAIDRLEKSCIDEVVLLDTIQQPEGKLTDKFTVVTVADLFAEAIERIYADLPVSKLYE